MRSLVLLFVISASALLSGCVTPQEKGSSQRTSVDRFGDRPKLVVGITVDQMRMDYLYRYWHLFPEGGFKRLINDGFVCTNNHYDYAPTYTGPGHASIYTGTSPMMHGIIANNWHVRDHGMVYCAGDSSQQGVGTASTGGQMSPHRLLTTTLSDELRLSNNFQSKVLGISFKDRGAILPAGHNPTAAYWFIGKNEGNFVSSTYYMNTLPDWVNEFNAKRGVDSCLTAGWDLLLPEEAYDVSYDDNNPFEAPFRGQMRAAFPYDFSEITEGRYDYIKATPHSSSLSVDFAIAAIEGEQLGKGAFSDLLALSFSGPDYAGHQFGPQSREVQDTYLRLDGDIKRLLNYLDQRIGKNEYLIFLTADHGGAPVPKYMNRFNLPGGIWRPQEMIATIEEQLSARYGQAEYISSYSNDQVFLNKELLRKKGVKLEEAAQIVAAVCSEFPEVYRALTRSEVLRLPAQDPIMKTMRNGIHPQRSGDVVVLTQPGLIEHGYQGTTHGSPYSYDTHVPLLFYGKNVPTGQLARRTHITDIAPTVAQLIRIGQPTGCTGNTIHEIVDAPNK